MNPDADGVRSAIEREYELRGYRLGWRLLSSPWRTVSGSRLAFIGLNPGGFEIPSGHPDLAPDTGSAYVDEVWTSWPAGEAPLQRQVRSLFEKLGERPEDVLAGNLVPFRSPSWTLLAHREQALSFGTFLWTELLAAARPELVVTMSGIVFERLCREYRVVSRAEMLNWGNVRVRFGRCAAFRIVGLPHLSRFPVIDRDASQSALAKAFSWQQQPPTG